MERLIDRRGYEENYEYGLPKPRWTLEDGDDFRVVILRPQLGTGPLGIPVSDAVNEAVNDAVNEAVKSLYECIKLNPGFNGRKLAATLSCNEPMIDRHVKALKKKPDLSNSVALPRTVATIPKWFFDEEVKKFNLRSTPTPSTYTFLIVGGRLGDYKYYDMDQAMLAALEIEV